MAGIYSQASNTAWAGSSTRRGKIDWIPGAHVPVLDNSGRMSPAWYRFFREVADNRLGGIDAPTVPDVVTTAKQTQAQVLTVKQDADAAIQTVNSCVDAVNTTKQVAVNNNLSGSTQIPTLQRLNPKVPQDGEL